MRDGKRWRGEEGVLSKEGKAGLRGTPEEEEKQLAAPDRS